MADLTSVYQTYDNTGTGIAASYLSANNLKSVASSRFGTRELSFIKITLSGIETSYTASNSTFVKALKGLQTMAEIYMVGTPASNNVIVAVAADTLTTADSATDLTAGYGLLEAAINAATGGSSTVAAITTSGASWS